MALAVFRVIQLLRVDTLHGNVMREQSTLILHRKAENIAICNGILNHIAMQAGIALRPIRKKTGVEHIGSGSAVSTLIRLKDRCTSKADIICFLEVTVDITVHLSELRAVALINDENHLLCAERIHQGFIALGIDSIRHLLNGCDNQFTVRILQLLHQNISAVRIVYTILLKGIIFINRLVIEVFTVNQEDDFINPWLIPKNLRQLKRCKRLSRASAGKNIAILVCFKHTLLSCLYRKYLIRTHNHQNRLCGFDDHILVNHLRDSSLTEELRCELFQRIDTLVLCIRPEEDKALQNGIVHPVLHLVLVAEILRLHRVGDHKELKISEQSLERELAITVNLIDSLVDFNTRTLQFNLNKRETVNQHCHIISVLV